MNYLENDDYEEEDEADGTNDQPLFSYAYEEDTRAIAEIRLRFYEFDDETAVYNKLKSDKTGNVSEHLRAIDAQKYNIAIHSGRYRVGGSDGKATDAYRVVECFHYRDAFQKYYGKNKKDNQRLIHTADMLVLTGIAARAATDAFLSNHFGDCDFIEKGACEHDPCEIVQDDEFANLSLRFLLKPERNVDPKENREQSSIIKNSDALPLQLETMVSEITRGDDKRVNGCVLSYLGGNKLLTLIVRL